MKRLIQRCGAILVILALISGVLSSCGTEEVSSVEFNEETNTTHPATSETSLQWEVTTHTVTCAEHEQNIAITRVGDDYHLLCASLPNYGAMMPLDEAFTMKTSDSFQNVPLPVEGSAMVLEGESATWSFAWGPVSVSDGENIDPGSYNLYKDSDLYLRVDAPYEKDYYARCQMVEHEGLLYTCFNNTITAGQTVIPAPEIGADGTIYFLRGLVATGNQVYAWMETHAGEDGFTQGYLIPVTPETKSLSPGEMTISYPVVENLVETDGKYGYFVSGNSIMRTDGKTVDKLIDLLSFGVEPGYIRRFSVTDQGQILLIQKGEKNHDILEFAPKEKSVDSESDEVFQPATPTEHQTITLAVVQGLDMYITDAVATFNTIQEQYTIEVKVFEEVSQLNLALQSGEIGMVFSADILTMRNYASKGLLCDLERLVPELYADGVLLDNVVDAARLDGVSYMLPRTIAIWGMAIPEEYLGGKTINGYSDLLDALQGNETAIKTHTKSGLFSSFIEISLDHWIDWDTRTASFTDQSFLDLLTLCNQASHNQAAADGYSSTPLEFYRYAIAEGVMGLGFLEDDNERGSKKSTLLALPAGEHDGCAIYSSSLLSVVDNETYMAGGAEFLRFVFLRCSFPNGYGQGKIYLPINRSELDDYLGLKETTANATLEQQKSLTARYIDGADHYSYAWQNDLVDVCNEEASRYFAGDITAEKAAEYIQNRISIYLAEQG